MWHPMGVVILGLVVLLLELCYDIWVTSLFLPKVLKNDELASSEERVVLFSVAASVTGYVAKQRLILLLTLYLPALGVFVWQESFAWTTVAFFLITLLYAFRVTAAKNYDEVVSGYEEKLLPKEQRRLIRLMMKDIRVLGKQSLI